ncbi:cuticle protein AMP4-like [Homarus americanus]|uniref:cuticle protein AMP4-like n=1 Tax=Homarus americanus TaxID=6706 RepID=UPI001C442CCD|nr:cuticle protein AMP4-like [Homarus americanus]
MPSSWVLGIYSPPLVIIPHTHPKLKPANMKLVIFACLLALALARPQDPALAGTIRSENINEGTGAFKYGFETDQGIIVDAEGTPGIEGQSNINGAFRSPLGDGSFIEVTYIADERGYRPQVTVTRS